MDWIVEPQLPYCCLSIKLSFHGKAFSKLQDIKKLYLFFTYKSGPDIVCSHSGSKSNTCSLCHYTIESKSDTGNMFLHDVTAALLACADFNGALAL